MLASSAYLEMESIGMRFSERFRVRSPLRDCRIPGGIVLELAVPRQLVVAAAGYTRRVPERLSYIDLAILVGYLAVTVGFACWFGFRRTTTSSFLTGGRLLPGWAVGLSMFGSYVSSISFLGNPGKSFASNWNAFVFSLATPIAAFVAVRWFVPSYRSSGGVSAYEHLERRSGPWARTYAVICFLLT